MDLNQNNVLYKSSIAVYCPKINICGFMRFWRQSKFLCFGDEVLRFRDFESWVSICGNWSWNENKKYLNLYFQVIATSLSYTFICKKICMLDFIQPWVNSHCLFRISLPKISSMYIFMYAPILNSWRSCLNNING